MKTCATHLECAACRAEYRVDRVINLCSCGKPLLVRYDLEKARKSVEKSRFASRPGGMWKYSEVLPIAGSANVVSLGEGGTRLLEANSIGKALGMDRLYLKDESSNPTGSFKARGLAMAVSRAKELGLRKLIVPTAGNAGSALAAYSARAGIDACVVMPSDSDPAFMKDCTAHGARVELIDGSIKECGEFVATLVEREGYFSVATLKEPYRIEGKKTMGYELAEQCDYELPDVIIYPTGGGTGLIGMWKAFDEMESLGLIGPGRPKMVTVQSEGCAPMVKAFHEGTTTAETWPNPATGALGLRVPSAVGDFLILQALRQSGGTAVAVSEQEIYDGSIELAAREGLFAAPEGGATVAALRRLLNSGFINQTDSVVLFITGSGYKYLNFYSSE